MKRHYAYAFLLVLLSACATLNIGAPKSFNMKLQDGYTAVTAVVNTSGTLYAADKISDKDAKNVATTAQDLKDGLDIARSVHATDPKAGDDKLALTVQALTALQNYLTSRSGK